jgi:hypothetical protein
MKSLDISVLVFVGLQSLQMMHSGKGVIFVIPFTRTLHLYKQQIIQL